MGIRGSSKAHNTTQHGILVVVSAKNEAGRIVGEGTGAMSDADSGTGKSTGTSTGTGTERSAGKNGIKEEAAAITKLFWTNW